MIRNILTTLTAVMLAVLPAAADSRLIEQADSAYTSDDFDVAAQLYRQAIADEGPSAKLYYNLGNSYYRMGQNGNAILSYERALRLDPTDKDARSNLEFVNTRITDRPGERGTFLGNLMDAAAATAKANTWAWLAFGCFALTVAAVMVYLFVDTIALRKTGFFGGIVTALGCVVFLLLAFRGASAAVANDVAIITAPSTILSTVPRTPTDRSQEAMLLHEGTRVVILDSVTSTSAADSVRTVWYDAEVDNAHRAWINSADVEKVVY